VSAAILLVAATIAGAPIAPDRTRTVAGWTVSDRSEQDGGRLVTLVKDGRGWRLEHHFSLWHGNGGVYVGATFRWRGCDSGEADYLFRWDEPVTSEILAQRTRDYMDECGLSDAEEERVLEGLPAANGLAQRWVEDFRLRLVESEGEE
jgi:hypothetical protein